MPYIFPRLQQIISRGEDLPTLPTIVLQLHRALDDPRAGPARVAWVIEQDPALTTRLLRVVNSALYSNGGPRLTSVPAAVSKLGMNRVRATCLVLAVVKALLGNARATLTTRSSGPIRPRLPNRRAVSGRAWARTARSPPRMPTSLGCCTMSDS